MEVCLRTIEGNRDDANGVGFGHTRERPESDQAVGVVAKALCSWRDPSVALGQVVVAHEHMGSVAPGQPRNLPTGLVSFDVGVTAFRASVRVTDCVPITLVFVQFVEMGIGERCENPCSRPVVETDDLDWKSELPSAKGLSATDYPKDIAAMANSGGGLIVYGVKESQKAATERQDVGELGVSPMNRSGFF